MNDFLTTANVAKLAGVHRDTLLRWLREQNVPEPQRDRRGWRVFTHDEAQAVAAFAGGEQFSTSINAHTHNDASLQRLKKIEWDFAKAKTQYLTHGLHPYPAKFIPQIPNALIQELSSVGETIADIFCGSGTTLLEALQLKRNSIGIDANPLAAMISLAKTTPLTESEIQEVEEHQTHCERVLASIDPLTNDIFSGGQPFTSAGWRPEPKVCEFWFLPHAVEELAEIRRLLDLVPSAAPKNFCSVMFASIIVVVSKQDSDTRYVRREKNTKPGDTLKKYLAQLKSAIVAIRELGDLIENRFSCKVLSNNILDSPSTERFDLMVTSPPYPNAFSYHLYHRTRLIWLGHDQKLFKDVEIGSHRKYSAKGANRATEETFLKEFENIFHWLRERLNDGRHACFIIGDSTLNGTRIDNASLIAQAGAGAGFREVARIPREIASTRKSFNPKIGKIKNENILILQKA